MYVAPTLGWIAFLIYSVISAPRVISGGMAPSDHKYGLEKNILSFFVLAGSKSIRPQSDIFPVKLSPGAGNEKVKIWKNMCWLGHITIGCKLTPVEHPCDLL